MGSSTFVGRIHNGNSKTMVMMMTQNNYDDGHTYNAGEQDVIDNGGWRYNRRELRSVSTSSSLHTSSRHCVCGAEVGEGSSSSSLLTGDLPISVKLKMCHIISKEGEEKEKKPIKAAARSRKEHWPQDTKTTIYMKPIRMSKSANIPIHARGGYDRDRDWDRDRSSSRDRSTHSEPVFVSCQSTSNAVDEDPGRTIFGIGGEEHDVNCPCHPQHPDYAEALLGEVSGRRIRNEANRNLVILRLLHEVVHLINSDSPIREEAFRITHAMHSSSSMNQETCMPCQQRMMPPHPFEPTPKKKNVQHQTESGDEETIPSDLYVDDEAAGIDTDELMKLDDGSNVCICPKSDDICPMHGPIKALVKMTTGRHGSCHGMDEGGDENISEMEEEGTMACIRSSQMVPMTDESKKDEYDPCFNAREYAIYTLPEILTEKYPPIWGSKPKPYEEGAAGGTETVEADVADETGKKGFMNSCAVFGKWLMYILTSKFQRNRPVEPVNTPSGHEISPIELQAEECLERFSPCKEFGEYMLCALSQKIYGNPETAFEMTEDVGEDDEERAMQSVCARILNRFLNENNRSAQPLDIRETEPNADYCVKLGDYIVSLLVSKQGAISEGPGALDEPCCSAGRRMITDGKEEDATVTTSTEHGEESDAMRFGGRPHSAPATRHGSEEDDGDDNTDIFYDCNESSESGRLAGTADEPMGEEECGFCDMVQDYIRDLAEGRDPDQRLMLNILQEKTGGIDLGEEEEEEQGRDPDQRLMLNILQEKTRGINLGEEEEEEQSKTGSGRGDGNLYQPKISVETSELEECEDCDCCYCRSRCGNELSKYSGGGDQLDEMKIFIESLICDLEAMQYAREQREQPLGYCTDMSGQICSSKGPEKGYPVSIVQVEELGSSSLYVKWDIIDSKGIGGYEIYVDDRLTNRYYNGSHKAAVVTNMDVGKSHKVTLVAKPCNESDLIVPGDDCSDRPGKSRALPPPPGKNENIENICEYIKDMSKAVCKSIDTSKWVPSVYIYNPTNGGDCNM